MVARASWTNPSGCVPPQAKAAVSKLLSAAQTRIEAIAADAQNPAHLKEVLKSLAASL